MQKTSTRVVRRPAITSAARVAVLTILSLIASTAAAELPPENAEGWSLRKETDSIKVFTIDQPDSSFQAFKAVALLDAPIENVMAVMINPKSCVEWVHNCSESYAFGEGNFHDRYAYSVNDMPWPVTDRDYVLRIRTRTEAKGDAIVMDLNAVPDRRDETDGHIRVDQSDTLYRFTAEGDKTRMVWVQHTDPNGSIPGWLVNSLLVDIPIKSMEQLEKVAQKERYTNHKLLFNANGQLYKVEAQTNSGDDES